MSDNIYARVLALDVGQRRIGMAISDPLGMTAQALPTFHRGEDVYQDLQLILNLIKEREVKIIVVGLPYNMNGSLGEQAEKIKDFAEKLTEVTGMECKFVDERLTTAAADRLMKMDGQSRKKRSQHADQVAAQLILQSYLGASSGIR